MLPSTASGESESDLCRSYLCCKNSIEWTIVVASGVNNVNWVRMPASGDHQIIFINRRWSFRSYLSIWWIKKFSVAVAPHMIIWSVATDNLHSHRAYMSNFTRSCLFITNNYSLFPSPKSFLSSQNCHFYASRFRLHYNHKRVALCH